jgi:signal-transduction protein with cAMP-binding, CBS, and nucleotidyltransferase domain
MSDRDILERLDTFPYRHRVAEVMSAPLSMAAPDTRLDAAARRMTETGVSSLLVVDRDGAPLGIVTERDVLRAFAADTAAAAGLTLRETMSAPVATVPADAFVYIALGRMARLGVRHLLVIGADGAPAGMITGRALLKLRAADTLRLGEELAHAGDAAAMDAVRAQLPRLCERLRAEGVAALDVAAVISGVYRDMTTHAGKLALAAMADAGRGEAPAPWCLLVLGSGGRGESLLVPDQDNAIVHAGTASDDPWFAEFGERTAALLDAAGIPFCKGGVMASQRPWRRSLEEWRAALDEWVRAHTPQDLLAIDIFFDFAPVLGERALARELRGIAAARAREGRVFRKLLAERLQDLAVPLGLFGRFRTEGGRIDLKRGGLLPLVSGARVMALGEGIEATATRARIEALRGAGRINAADAEAMLEAGETLVAAILGQQLADIAAGEQAGTRVDPRRLGARGRDDLRRALRAAENLAMLARDAQVGG